MTGRATSNHAADEPVYRVDLGMLVYSPYPYDAISEAIGDAIDELPPWIDVTGWTITPVEADDE